MEALGSLLGLFHIGGSMGKYCAAEAVKVRVRGKVKFSAPGEVDENKMGLDLLNVLISEAESQLEIDLMDRYEIPFQTIAGEPFAKLPENTKVTLKNLAELLSMIRVLETDFGRGTSVNGDKYTEACQKRYNQVVAQLVQKRKVNGEETRQWERMPLNNLKASYNNQGDNGFRGRVHNTSTITHQADYAAKQINSPGENIFNGIIDPLDVGDVS
jgi:hypothetical protein